MRGKYRREGGREGGREGREGVREEGGSSVCVDYRGRRRA